MPKNPEPHLLTLQEKINPSLRNWDDFVIDNLRNIRSYMSYKRKYRNKYLQEILLLVVQQLKAEGRMILPFQVGLSEQYLVLITKLTKEKIKQTKLLPVRFAPLI